MYNNTIVIVSNEFLVSKKTCLCKTSHHKKVIVHVNVRIIIVYYIYIKFYIEHKGARGHFL